MGVGALRARWQLFDSNILWSDSFFMRLLTILFSLLLACGCSRQTSSSPSPGAAGPPLDPAAPGMVWRVADPQNQTHFYLAGSFHLLRPQDYPLPAPYETAWMASRHVIFEIPPGDAASAEIKSALAPLLTLPAGQKLQDRITADSWSRLSTWAADKGFPLKQLETSPPWLAALSVTIATVKSLGFDSRHGIEQSLAARLAESGKTSEGLETSVGQITLFQNLPAATQEAMLRQSLLDVELLPQKAAVLTKAWRQGDTDTLHNTLSLSFQDFPELRRAILTDRNAAWLPRLEALLQSPAAARPAGPTFVLVGAAHLCGPDGLLALLRSKGYAVEHLLPAAAAKPSPVPAGEPAPGHSPVQSPTPVPAPSIAPPAPGKAA